MNVSRSGGLAAAAVLALGIGGAGLLTTMRGDAVFEMLTADVPTVPASVTWTRASEAFCPGGTDNAAGTWVSSNTPCTNDYGAGIWESRTNQLTRSQEIDNAAWSKEGVTATANQTAAPDGTTTADLITASAGSSIHRYYACGDSVTSGTSSTFSVYLKAGTALYATVNHTGVSGAAAAATVNMATGAIQACFGVGSSCVSTAAGNGWYRIALTFLPTSSGGECPVVQLCTTPGVNCGFSTSWTAAGTETLFVWGHQTEKDKSFATPYIRTTGTAVTRAADVASLSTPTEVTDADGCSSATVFAKSPASGQRLFGFGSTNRLALSSTTAAHFYDSTNTTTATALSTVAGRQVATRGSWIGTTAGAYHDAQTGTGTYDGALLGATTYLGSDGSGNFLNGYLENIKLDNSSNGCGI